MIKKLINDELVEEIYKAILANKDFSYSKDGLNIKAGSSENGIYINCSFKDDGSEKIRKEFYKFVDDMDDDLFLEVCKTIGDETYLKGVSDMIENNNTLEEGIEIFMKAYKECLPKLIKNLDAQIADAKSKFNELCSRKEMYLKLDIF